MSRSDSGDRGWGEDYVSGLATVDMGLVGTNAYYVLVDTFNSPLDSQVNVQVACTAGTTRANARTGTTRRTGRTLSRAQIESNLADMAARREAAHRAEK